MRDFLYDLKRTLTGKFTIIMIALIVLFTAGIAFAAVSTSSSSATPPGSEAYLLPAVFDSNGTYKVVDYAVNGYGQPVQGLRIVSYLTNVSSQNGGAGHFLIYPSQVPGNFNTIITTMNTLTESMSAQM
ncbi:MAG: hypothetical protein M1431_02665 [Candidatus Thermoplasmatota archaeon]|nr:hypothetical protein [Candidatus Thermoplasmatota archaeon]